MRGGMFGPGTLVLGGGAILMGAFLAVGFLLPGRWSADAATTLAADPVDVLRYLDSPEGWRAWTPWPDSVTRSGPERGPGAGFVWSSRELGSGAFRIDDVDDTAVRYSVDVAGAGGSTLRTRGTVTLTPGPGGTSVRWHEEGDLGRNPLMGYWALFMERAQSTERQKSLERPGEAAADPPTG